jgi:hypothetical protein
MADFLVPPPFATSRDNAGVKWFLFHFGRRNEVKVIVIFENSVLRRSISTEIDAQFSRRAV